MAPEYFDVLIMGAGLSGIDAAYQLQKHCPKKTYVILEQRARVGGTWDLFRYPGIRSDSDMLTMGYSFRPWTNPKAISPGEDIRNYIADTAREYGIDAHIRFRHHITSAAWSTEEACWHVQAVRTTDDGHSEPVELVCNFLFSCAGYYRYSAGYAPDFPGQKKFQGDVIHPQAWPENYDYSGKRVVIIGSGATAVTLIPAMAETATHVTMLQRSPSYLISMPGQDAMANKLRTKMSPQMAFQVCRWRNIGFGMLFYNISQRFPNFMKKRLLNNVRKQLGPEYDIDTHFTPRYNPWDQRLCLVPDADMFDALKSGKASVVTDNIETFAEHGILLKSGRELEADIIVTATGLVMQAYGGIEMSVDGKTVEKSKAIAYKGLMLSGVPNFASTFGYINASWTLKADLVCFFVCRLLNHMSRKGMRQVMPNGDGVTATSFFVDRFRPGYMERALEDWPRQGASNPWRSHQNYLKDMKALKWNSLDDGVLQYSNPSPAPGQRSSRELAEVSR